MSGTPPKGFIGFNTGCSKLYPLKKLALESSISLIKKWRELYPEYIILLLGGKEDALRQNEMKKVFSEDSFVVNTPCDEGLRSGILWLDISDLIFSGDSLGMHIAIALEKKVIAWFGLSCSQEIDLYDKGYKIKSDVTCGPCWKKKCNYKTKCNTQISLSTVLSATSNLL